MTTETQATASPTDTIPHPDAIRQRMTAIRTEGRLLRELLRAAELRERLARRQSADAAKPAGEDEP